MTRTDIIDLEFYVLTALSMKSFTPYSLVRAQRFGFEEQAKQKTSKCRRYVPPKRQFPAGGAACGALAIRIVGVAITFCTRLRQVFVSNLCRDTGCPEVFRVFLSLSR